MSIGRMAISVFLILILALSMLAIISILTEDRTTDPYFDVHSTVGTINRTANLTENVLGTGTGLITPLTLVVAIIFLFSAFLIFRRL